MFQIQPNVERAIVATSSPVLLYSADESELILFSLERSHAERKKRTDIISTIKNVFLIDFQNSTLFVQYFTDKITFFFFYKQASMNKRSIFR